MSRNRTVLYSVFDAHWLLVINKLRLLQKEERNREDASHIEIMDFYRKPIEITVQHTPQNTFQLVQKTEIQSRSLHLYKLLRETT